MHDLLAQHGYPALFALSFLAATLIPLGSEWLLVALILQKRDPLLAVTVATAGNYLGACTTYVIGLWGGSYLVRKLLRIDDGAQARGERLYARYGVWSLLFSWLPLIGDPLCLVGGIMKVPFPLFSILVATGKLGRYAAIAWLTLQGMSIAT